MDRLSGLSENIMLRIVSFMSAECAARAKTMCKVMNPLIGLIEDQYYVGREDGISEFATTLSGHNPNLRLKIFYMTLLSVTSEESYSSLCQCLLDVVVRGVMDIHLRVLTDQTLSLPPQVFRSHTLVELILSGNFTIESIPSDSFLPVLTRLHTSVKFSGSDFKTLISACPSLKSLNVDGSDWPKVKWSTTRRLICCDSSKYYNFSPFVLDCAKEASLIEDLDIYHFKGSEADFSRMRDILGLFPSLRVVNVEVTSLIEKSTRMTIMNRLLGIPRKSPFCAVKIEFLA